MFLNMKTNILHRSLIWAAAALVMSACTEGDKFDYSPNVAFMSGTDVNPITKFVVEDTPSFENVSVSLSKPAEKDLHVRLAIDPSKVDEYNKAHNTNFFAVPNGCAELVTTEAVIPAGKSFSEAVQVRMNSTATFEEGRVYVVPVTIKDAEGVEILQAQSTIFLQIARVLYFTALDLSNPQMYSNFIFADNLKAELGAFTYEIKFYSQDWHRIARLCSFTSKDEQKSSMLRFGENGLPLSSCQWVSPGGSVVSSTEFSTDRWYTLSLVYDGSNLYMYVDGNLDAQGQYSGTVDFQRIEMGMSWTGYRSSQYFKGRVAEMRVWNRALTPGEIKLGLCGVDSASDGLLAYWKFNEGSGHIFHDATGHGYDMDWTKTCREINEGAGLADTPDAANAVAWNSDDTNRCSE